MAELIFLQNGKHTSVSAAPQETILAAARKAGLLLESPCNGNGTCGKCRITLTDACGAKKNVLACTTLAETDATISFIDRADGHALQIKQDGPVQTFQLDGAIRKTYLPQQNRTVVHHFEQSIAEEVGDTCKEAYGLLVDVGTTTLVAAVVDLLSGEELASTGALNPQSRLAQDVLSRIRYASSANGLAEMQRLLIAELNRMLDNLTAQSGILRERIYEVVLSGNTCMLHLAARINPQPLGASPYTPGTSGDEYRLASELGLVVSPAAKVYLPPIISAYVGADITSGLLATDLAAQRGIQLFVDIGTNGEIVLAVNGTLSATSTAAGPAFEGMNISQGMRAAPGAIEAFRLTADGQREVRTIGNQPALGLCGSGLLDVAAQLVQHKLIGKTGRFNKEAPGLSSLDGKLTFTVSGDIRLTQQDVRQLQLAKGAIRSGIEALLAAQNIAASAVDRVLIAGSFGYHLNEESLLAIGLLPDAFRGKVDFIGNTSKSGAQVLLLSQAARRQAAATAASVSVLELAQEKDFDKLFVSCLAF
ncbi:ASKHA domain-containing protein [Azotosporobacter soli]|uniref:ASKHA domain-containing protein n=1 Tax=Azotosporobacter soli TaxID=3055040 RepID=UPI0031FEAF08